MGDVTGIAWTDATWNPWQGCHKVSEACKNCYMFRDKKRYGQDANVVVRSAKSTFFKPLTWMRNREKYADIKRVFTCSWSDFFIEEADPWREEAWDVIRATPELTYQILTKRPERWPVCLPKNYLATWSKDFAHVQFGTTIEHPKHAQRINDLLDIPGKTHFASVEPMLGDFAGFDWYGVDWLIAGCESGPMARETNLDWVRVLRDECELQCVPFFLKQLMIDGKLVTTPELDGSKWTEFPEAQA